MAFAVLLAAVPAQAATFTVNTSTTDAQDANLGDGQCDWDLATAGNQCTLRAAIEQANATSGADTINFNIGGTASVKTISPASELPAITEAVTINGYSQSGASPNTLAEGNNAVIKIQLDGTNAGDLANGLVIEASDSTIKGLAVNRFALNGILIFGSSTRGNKVEGNFIGTDAAGSSALGNGDDGVVVSGAPNNTIGGTAAAVRNIISGNENDGVRISSSGAAGRAVGNQVLGNFIGTNAAGSSALGNVNGVVVSGSNINTIGGTAAGARNVISGNGNDGILIFGSSATGNKVEGNFIGTTADGSGDLGNANDGVDIQSGSNNTVGGTASGAGNRIAFNDSDGVQVLGSSAGNRVLFNSIFSNGGLGIQLNNDGVTNNDTDDPDTGPNNLQNFPVISSATRGNTSRLTFISGTLNSNPNQEFTVQCFEADDDPSGHGEGERFLTEDTSVTTDANGDASFSCITGSLAVGTPVSATATNETTGDTSEFSQAVAVS